jgi:hypothetical protein
MKKKSILKIKFFVATLVICSIFVTPTYANPWFVWHNTGPTWWTFEPNDTGNAGLKGGCVSYQEQTCYIFGIAVGTRMKEGYGNCENMVK